MNFSDVAEFEELTESQRADSRALPLPLLFKPHLLWLHIKIQIQIQVVMTKKAWRQM